MKNDAAMSIKLPYLIKEQAINQANVKGLNMSEYIRLLIMADLSAATLKESSHAANAELPGNKILNALNMHSQKLDYMLKDHFFFYAFLMVIAKKIFPEATEPAEFISPSSFDKEYFDEFHTSLKEVVDNICGKITIEDQKR